MFLVLLADTFVLVLVTCMSPFPLSAVATFFDIAVFPEQCSALPVSM